MQIERYLGEAIKWLRSQRGWPQKQLAAAADITRSMVSSYENGKQTPTLHTLDKIMAALEADLCDLHCAFEHVHGRAMTVHELSAHFRYGQARARKAMQPEGSVSETMIAEAHESGGASSEQALSVDLERALSDMVAGAQKLLRHALLRK